MNAFDNFILKNSKVLISFFGFIFIISLISFLYVVGNKDKFNKKSIEQKYLLAQITVVPSQEKVLAEYAKAETEWDIGKMLPGTTETIEIKAENETDQDKIAFIRLRVEGGEVIDITSPYTIFKSCIGEKTTDKVCVDIVKAEPFIKGEVIATLNIKWLDTPIQRIFKSSEFGFYNGSVFNSSN